MTGATQLRLLWSPKSPFVRKVMIYAHELGVAQQIELVRAIANPFGVPNPQIMEHNPLGKIPTLLIEGHSPIVDSAFICRWLATYASAPQLEGDTRLAQEQWEVIADGWITNLLQIRLLHQTSPEANSALLTSLTSKVRACLCYFETEIAAMSPAPFGLGQVALICALGQLDFRFPDCGWTAQYPNLSAWQAEQNTRASVIANPIVDDQNTPNISTSLYLGKE